MTTAKKKKIATWIIVPLMAAIFLFDIVSVVLGNIYTSRIPIENEPFDGRYTDRIHFLNTANSDAILLESDGHFALIDSGEGSHNPRRKGKYHGFEETVIAYLKKAAADETDTVHLDFILGTHAHYDHIGCYHAILQDETIQIGTAYFKPYDPSLGKSYEDGWGEQTVYDEILQDLTRRGIPLVQNLPTEPFRFGNFTLQFFNTVTPKSMRGQGENGASIGTKVTKGTHSAFLAADITRTTGLTKLLEDEIGHVDVLKLGHHGYYGSGSFSWYRKLSPEIGIVTNRLGKIYPNEKWMLIFYAKLPLFATAENDGVIVNFTDTDELVLTRHIHGG